MYLILDKDTIEMEIVPNIPIAQRGFPPRVPVAEIINAILYKLKTGVQWHLLPVDSLFDTKALSWQCVYYHYRKWCLSESWQRCWEAFLRKHKAKLDLSSVGLDGSHTTAIRGGDGVDYQGRKKRYYTLFVLSQRDSRCPHNSLILSNLICRNLKPLLQFLCYSFFLSDIGSPSSNLISSSIETITPSK